MDRLLWIGRRYGQLMGLKARMDLAWYLRDRRVVLICMGTDAVSAVASVMAVYFLAERFDGLCGLTRPQVLFMLGFGLLIEGLRMVFFGNDNASAPSRRFGRGQVDHMLMQPVPVWLQLITDGFAPVTSLAVFLSGAAFTAWAIHQLALPLSILWWARFAGQLVSALGVLMGFTYLTSVPAFYAPVAAEEISSTVGSFFSSLKPFPLGGLGGGARFLLTVLLPVGLTAWYPASALLTPAHPLQLWAAPAMALALIAASAFFLRKGLDHYVRVGSPRYSRRGFRN